MTQPLDLAAYRHDGIVVEKAIPTADKLRARGQRELAWELRRVDLAIAMHERNRRDWIALRDAMTTVEGADFVADSIERETFKITDARMLRDLVLRTAGQQQ